MRGRDNKNSFFTLFERELYIDAYLKSKSLANALLITVKHDSISRKI